MKMQKMFLVVLLIAFLATLMIAQSSTAKITGKVVTADGTAIPGVMVTATNPKMIGKSISISDENGVYRLLNLGAGVYKVIFELEGFATMVQPKVVLGVEQTLRIPIVMRLKKLKETIIVEGQVPLIDVKSASQGMNISKETFDSLPKGRDFTSLVTAIPGVQAETLSGGISVDGASGSENMFYIDGVDVTNPVSGVQGQNASFDFIEEVQVKSSGYMAEFGGSLGGVISAITRSGGNEFHGDIVAYYSGSALRGTPRELLALDKTDASKATYYPNKDLLGERTDTRIEAGLSLGGYLLKDRIWFFGSFLPKFTTYKNHVEYVGSTNVKDHETKFKSMNFMLKLSAQIFSNVRWSASYMNNYHQYRGFDFFEDAGAWGPYGNYEQDYDSNGFDFPNYSASTSLDITIGNNSMLNIRAGMYYKNQENNQTTIPDTPWYLFAGTNNLSYPEIPDNLKHSTGWSSGGAWTESRALVKALAEKKSISGDYTLYFNLAGEHSLKVGGQFVRQGEAVDDAWQQPLVLIYWGRDANLHGTDYAGGKYGYVQVRGNERTGMFGSEYEAYSNRFNLYIQDSWTIGEKLTLNFGIRAESEYIPSYSKHPDFVDAKPIDFGFGDKLAPRFGFVYDVKGDSSLKIFGSYGLFFDVMKLEMANGAYGGFKWKSAYYALNDYDYTKFTKTDEPEADLYRVIDWRIPSFDSTEPTIRPMSQQAISLGFENKISDEISLSVRLVNKHLRYAIEDIGYLTPEGEKYIQANPGYGWSLTEANGGKLPNILPDTPKAKREYWAVNIGLNKRFSNNWMGGFSYTWSRLSGNYSGLASTDEDGRTDPNVNRFYDSWFMAFDKNLEVIDGVLATDRTHVIKAYGSYVFPFGLTMGTVINVMSGTPITEAWDMVGAWGYPNGRGSLGRTPMLYNADIYAEYNMKLGKANLLFSVNVSNVFNFKISQRTFFTRNANELSLSEEDLLDGSWTYPTDSVNDPRFNMPFGYTAPISARLGLKLSF